MHISSLITGLLGLASLTSGAVIKTKTGLVIGNTTKGANDTSCRTGFKMPPLPGGLHGGHGPVVIPDDRCANNSHSRQEANTTIGVTISNTTKDTNDTSSKVGWPQWVPVIEGGPGPAVIPEDLWKELLVHANDSHSWLVASQIEEHEPLRRGRRVSTEERRAALTSKRDGPGDPLPPRDRNLADHMEQHGSMLPECYQRCMRQEDGKSSIHMGQDSLGKICGIKWGMFAWWSEHDLYDCVNGGGGCANKEDHRVAYRWLKWTCGDKPSRV